MACCGSLPKEDGAYIFYPDYREVPVREKFYARHEQFVGVPKDRVQFYQDEVQKVWDYDARDHCKVPRYSSQVYGWLKYTKLPRLERCGMLRSGNPDIYEFVRNDYLENRHYKQSKWDTCVCKQDCYKDHWKIV